MRYKNAFIYPRHLFNGAIIGIACTTVLAFTFRKEKLGCAITLNKMNVFYIGVDNPVTIVVRGVPEGQIVLDVKGIELIKQGEGDHYIVRARTTGEATITVSGGDLAPTTFRYRIKQFPDPVPLLGAQHKSGTISNGVFKAQGGLAAQMNSGYGCGNCGLVSFELSYVVKDKDPITILNAGARYNAEAQKLINQAVSGNYYYFDAIKAKCPGDVAPRDLGSLAFKIR